MKSSREPITVCCTNPGCIEFKIPIHTEALVTPPWRDDPGEVVWGQEECDTCNGELGDYNEYRKLQRIEMLDGRLDALNPENNYDDETIRQMIEVWDRRNP